MGFEFDRRQFMGGAALVGVGLAVGGGTLLKATPALAAGPYIYSCEEWGARPAKWDIDEYPPPQRIIIHHAVKPNNAPKTLERAFEVAREIQNDHMDNPDKLYPDTGQHFTVSRGGYVLEGRHKSLRLLNDKQRMVEGGHCLVTKDRLPDGTPIPYDPDPLKNQQNQNNKSIGIENEGIFSADGIDPPAELMEGLVQLCTLICRNYEITPSGDTIRGHRDYFDTDCPGDRMYAKLDWLRTEVDTRLSGTAPGPR